MKEGRNYEGKLENKCLSVLREVLKESEGVFRRENEEGKEM